MRVRDKLQLQSNHCHLACHRPQGGNTVVVLAVEDNLVKGAGGQAMGQNLAGAG